MAPVERLLSSLLVSFIVAQFSAFARPEKVSARVASITTRVTILLTPDLQLTPARLYDDEYTDLNSRSSGCSRLDESDRARDKTEKMGKRVVELLPVTTAASVGRRVGNYTREA